MSQNETDQTPAQDEQEIFNEGQEVESQGLVHDPVTGQGCVRNLPGESGAELPQDDPYGSLRRVLVAIDESLADKDFHPVDEAIEKFNQLMHLQDQVSDLSTFLLETGLVDGISGDEGAIGAAVRKLSDLIELRRLLEARVDELKSTKDTSKLADIRGVLRAKVSDKAKVLHIRQLVD